MGRKIKKNKHKPKYHPDVIKYSELMGAIPSSKTKDDVVMIFDVKPDMIECKEYYPMKKEDKKYLLECINADGLDFILNNKNFTIEEIIDKDINIQRLRDEYISARNKIFDYLSSK